MAKLIDEKKQEIIYAISEKLSQAENEHIVLDEDKEVYLFNGDTEEQLGECFRIEFLSQTHLMGQTQVYVWVDTDENNPNPREGWLLDDCTEYELNLIYNTFFNDWIMEQVFYLSVNPFNYDVMQKLGMYDAEDLMVSDPRTYGMKMRGGKHKRNNKRR